MGLPLQAMLKDRFKLAYHIEQQPRNRVQSPAQAQNENRPTPPPHLVQESNGRPPDLRVALR